MRQVYGIEDGLEAAVEEEGDGVGHVGGMQLVVVEVLEVVALHGVEEADHRRVLQASEAVVAS